MESKHEIPEDLKARYEQLHVWINGPLLNTTEMPWELSHKDELALVERIAALEAALAEARSRLGPLADATQVAGISGGRVMYVVGYPQDVKTVENALHDSFEVLPKVRTALSEARSQIEALNGLVEREENDKTLLRELLQKRVNRCDALEAQLADYGKPVTDEEWQKVIFAPGRWMMDYASLNSATIRGNVNDLIASRTQSRQGA